MTEDTDTVDLAPYTPPRPSMWVDVAIAAAVFFVVIVICLSTCGIKP